MSGTFNAAGLTYHWSGTYSDQQVALGSARSYDTLTLSIAGEFVGPYLGRFATTGWTTASDDSPAATPFLGRIDEDIEFVREVGCVFWGSNSQRSFIGAAVLLNGDGRLDGLRDEVMRDRLVEIHRGDVEAGEAFGDFELAATGIIDRVDFPNEVSCNVVLADRVAIVDRPLQERLYSGAVNTALDGQCLPVAIGKCLSVPAVMIDLDPPTYDLHETVPHDVLLVRSNGNELDPETQWDPAGNGFELLVQPFGRIVADVEGHAVEGVLVERLPDILRYLLTVRTISADAERPTSDPVLVEDDLDWDRINALDAAAPYKLCYWTDRPVTVRQVLTELMDSFGGWWWITRLGKLAVGRLELPSESPVLELTQDHLADDAQISVEVDRATGFSNVCCAQRNWHVHDPSEIATELTSPDVLQIGLDLQMDFRTRAVAPTTAEIRPVGTAVPRAYSPLRNTGIATLLSDPADAATEVARWAALYAEQRQFWTVPVLVAPSVALLLEIGQTVRLDVRQQVLVGDELVSIVRHGLENKLLLVVGIRGRLLSGRVDLKLWG